MSLSQCTGYILCVHLRFNLCRRSFLNNEVSEPQSNKALVFLKVCQFDSFMSITPRKKYFAPSCAFTAAPSCCGKLGV